MKILIVEDDQSIARLERNYLEINGYEVLHDPNGDLDYIMKVLPDIDLIILDLMLPGADGFDICRAIRNESGIPIIIISAKDQDMDVVLGLGLGANDYMKKPFSPNELVARVKSQLSNYLRVLNTEVKIDKKIELRGLVLDPDLNQAQYGGRVIELTKTEFDILYLLLNNLERVFSKQEIYERIWNQDALGQYDTISVHVRRIREKIEEDPANPKFIKTIWGVGYCIRK